MSTSGHSIVQHTSYGKVVLISTDTVEKNYENEQELLDEVKNFREELIELTTKNDSFAVKTYRVHSANDYTTTLPITIKARTKLEAIIAFADHDQKRIDTSYSNLEGMGLWFHLVGEERDDDILGYSESLCDRMTFIVEVEDEVITY